MGVGQEPKSIVVESAADRQISLEEAKTNRIKAELKSSKYQQRKEDKRRFMAFLSRLPIPIKAGVSVTLIVLLLIVFGVVLPLVADDGETQYLTETSLKNAVNIEDLAVIDYTYKGIAEKKGQFLWMDTVDYRVKYESHVRASYNMPEIEFAIDEAGKVVTAYLPEPQISEPIIDETKFGYLPENVTANMRDIVALCREDAAADVNVEEVCREAAGSLQDIVTALTMPLFDDGWHLEFKSLSDYQGNREEAAQNEIQ